MVEGRGALAAANHAKAAAKTAANHAKAAAETAEKAAIHAKAIAAIVGHLAELLGVGPVPDAHETVRAKSSHVLTVRRQRGLRDHGSRLVLPFRRGLRREAANFLARGKLPGANDAVAAGGNDALAAGMEAGENDWGIVPAAVGAQAGNGAGRQRVAAQICGRGLATGAMSDERQRRQRQRGAQETATKHGDDSLGQRGGAQQEHNRKRYESQLYCRSDCGKTQRSAPVADASGGEPRTRRRYNPWLSIS